MTPEAYREALSRLGLTQVGAGIFFNVGERTSRRWAAEGCTGIAEWAVLKAVALRERGWSLKKIRELAPDGQPPPI